MGRVFVFKGQARRHPNGRCHFHPDFCGTRYPLVIQHLLMQNDHFGAVTHMTDGRILGVRDSSAQGCLHGNTYEGGVCPQCTQIFGDPTNARTV